MSDVSRTGLVSDSGTLPLPLTCAYIYTILLGILDRGQYQLTAFWLDVLQNHLSEKAHTKLVTRSRIINYNVSIAYNSK